MTAVIRHSTFTNTTGAAVVAGGAPIEIEKNYSLHSRTIDLLAADIGTAVGQIRNAAGMLVGEIEGSSFKGINSIQVFRLAGGFWYKFEYLTDTTSNLGYQIATVNGKSTLRLIDNPTAANGRLAAGDKVVITYLAGN